MTNELLILNNRSATFLSVVFHPLIITTYLFAVLFLMVPDLVGVSALELPALASLLLLLFLNTFVAPSIVVYYFHKLGIISSLQADDLRERRWPYLASIILYAIATYLFGWQLQPIGELAPQISILLAGVTVSLIVIAAISFFWKISAHATAIGGVVGTFVGLLVRFEETALLIPLIISVVLAGFLLSARLYLNAHTPGQIVAGVLCGLLVGGLTVFFFL